MMIARHCQRLREQIVAACFSDLGCQNRLLLNCQQAVTIIIMTRGERLQLAS